MPGKTISDQRLTSQRRPQVLPGEAGPVKDRYSSVLAAELLGVEKTLDQNVADVLDRRNLPLLP